ncbi:hypothetical protein TEA_016458 [Camellia sinensis var. sinensis]|uniref:Sphingomyelin synthase-like domain-containing protein n=1 Tax=Camellia sinensis var. sinensis TaxID=542762 RepID=A0A4V3WIU8_CAMSN|nr:hypothetical protein TEA_016458 [Camellia sinensis var. sinensis]
MAAFPSFDLVIQYKGKVGRVYNVVPDMYCHVDLLKDIHESVVSNICLNEALAIHLYCDILGTDKRKMLENDLDVLDMFYMQSKLWKRFWAEITTELKLLFENWKYLVAGIICQYIHGLAARGVHYFHQPGPILQDVGFFLLPELGQDKAYISETVFTFIFVSFFLGSKLATLPPPGSLHEVLLINFRGVLYGCGDLIFSSHMIFSLVFVRTYQKYGTRRFIKQCAWFTVVIQSLLIVAARKHYTVDVVVAWYTVNLVVYFIDHKLPELPDRSASFLLPLSKDGRTKEENHKLLNGNSGDPIDRRLRTPVNGKFLEEGNTVHVDTVMNGV